MAKKNDMGLIVGGLLILWVLSRNQRQRFTPNPAFPNYPAEPPKGTPDWVLWVNGVTQIAGGITAALFGPGGPFEGMTVQEVLQGSGGANPGTYEGAQQCLDPITWQPKPC